MTNNTLSYVCAITINHINSIPKHFNWNRQSSMCVCTMYIVHVHSTYTCRNFLCQTSLYMCIVCCICIVPSRIWLWFAWPNMQNRVLKISNGFHPQLFSSSSRSQQLTAAIQTITKPTSQRIVSNRNSHSNNGLSHLLIKWNASILLTRVQ